MRLLGYDDLRARGIRYSRTHIWRMVRAGRFPAPVQIGAGRNAWVEEEIDALIRQRIAERDGTAPKAA
jgi:prophage regulatory protein